MSDQPKTASPSDLWAAYSELRRRLEVFFKFSKGRDPEYLADETLFRVVRRVQEGAAITNLSAYALGVARFVLREQWKERASELESQKLYRVSMPQSGWSPEREALLEALDRAVKTLPTIERKILDAYYSTAGDEKINSRRELAKELRISENSLRIHLYRLRKKLRVEVERQLHAIEEEKR